MNKSFSATPRKCQKEQESQDSDRKSKRVIEHRKKARSKKYESVHEPPMVDFVSKGR